MSTTNKDLKSNSTNQLQSNRPASSKQISLAPQLDTSFMHLPAYTPLTGPPADPPPPYSILKPPARAQGTTQGFAHKYDYKRKGQGSSLERESKFRDFVASGMAGRSVLEVPGVGNETAKKFRSNEATEILFGEKILTAEQLFAKYLEDKEKFIKKLQCMGITKPNIHRIVSTFDSI